MVYICSSFELLADKSRDLSQDAKKITATQSDNFLVFLKPMLMRFFKKTDWNFYHLTFYFIFLVTMLKGFEGVQFVEKLGFEIPGTDLNEKKWYFVTKIVLT